MEELQKLYDALSRDGYYTKSFEEFQEQYADPAYRDKVFGVVTRDGLYTKSREEFDAKYSPVKKKRRFWGISFSSSGSLWRVGVYRSEI